MNPGSVIIDISIDQGGCVEGVHATTSEELSYIHDGVIHSAVPNMPAAVARTSSQALSSAILPYVHALADGGSEMLASEPSDGGMGHALYRARAISRGVLVDAVLQQEVEAAEANTAS